MGPRGSVEREAEGQTQASHSQPSHQRLLRRGAFFLSRFRKERPSPPCRLPVNGTGGEPLHASGWGENAPMSLQCVLSWNSRWSRQGQSAPDPGTWSMAQVAGAQPAQSSPVLPRAGRAFPGQFLLPPRTQGPPPTPGCTRVDLRKGCEELTLCGPRGGGPRGCPRHFTDPEARAQRGPAVAEGHGAGEEALSPRVPTALADRTATVLPHPCPCWGGTLPQDRG